MGDVNGFQVKLAKLEGDFVWHKHECVDEIGLAACCTNMSSQRDDWVYAPYALCQSLPEESSQMALDALLARSK